ncbi:MAG: hypothetical protein K6E50_11365 [Lachnospiraceae bacterium]|nr:hypothetical protein [Lachnospiraceae bacterium]
MSLIAPLVDGQFQTENSSSASLRNSKEEKGKSSVDSEAFLQLLVAEMQNQDPLEPTSNTEWVSQYATFTQVSEIQSIGDSMASVQAQGLVGKNVIMRVTDSTGTTDYIQGMVERIGYEDKKAYLYIDGSPYSIDDLDTVVSDEYMAAQEKVDRIRELIKKLPGMQNLTIGDQDTVMELGEILTGMSDYEKSFVDKDAIDEINRYGERMLALVSDQNAQDSAETLKKALASLPEVDSITAEEHADKIESLYSALQSVNDMVKDYLGSDNIARIEAYYERLQELRK